MDVQADPNSYFACRTNYVNLFIQLAVQYKFLLQCLSTLCKMINMLSYFELLSTSTVTTQTGNTSNPTSVHRGALPRRREFWASGHSERVCRRDVLWHQHSSRAADHALSMLLCNYRRVALCEGVVFVFVDTVRWSRYSAVTQAI